MCMTGLPKKRKIAGEGMAYTIEVQPCACCIYLLMFVPDASGDNSGSILGSIGLVMAFYVTTIVFPCC